VNLVYRILQGLLAAVMLMAGAMNATQGKDKLLADSKLGWFEDFSDSMVRTIGIVDSPISNPDPDDQ
jgi:hypothetical protein